MLNKIRFLLIFMPLLPAIPGLMAQHPESITLGTSHEIKSLVLEEVRPYLVATPPGYENSDMEYPVLYVLDGLSHFHHTSAAVNFLSRNGRMPEMIVVAIPNTGQRTRDLTPPTEESTRFPTAGGADKMIKFLQSELIPQINRTYRAKPYRVLIGHSFGGLFALHTMVNHPGIFDAYISISPSIWWDENKLVDQAEALFEDENKLEGHLYMTMGNEGGGMLGGAWKFAAVLKEYAGEDLTWHFALMEAETHGSVPYRSTYDGLEFIFSDWDLNNQWEEFMARGIAAVDSHIEKLKDQFGYAPEVPEGSMNLLGYQLLQDGKTEEAIAVFERNTEWYPQSSNVWDSYAEGLMEKGQNAKAIKYYKKSLEMNPGNTNAVDKLAELGIPREDLVIRVEVSDDLMRKYAGTYEIQDGPRVTITFEDGILYGQAEGTPRSELVPSAPDRFYMEGEDVQVRFVLDAEDNASIVLQVGDRPMKGKKIE
jgi:predicted alpha/beta superfamily hydrolase